MCVETSNHLDRGSCIFDLIHGRFFVDEVETKTIKPGLGKPGGFSQCNHFVCM